MKICYERAMLNAASPDDFTRDTTDDSNTQNVICIEKIEGLLSEM
ncbi:MAG: hypothetical protein R3227_00015 [Reinekea sp.]|nr:hypothetical protein [Reinekea sp.]